MSVRTVRAPAKVNLHLGVGAPREDGYHPLETVYSSIGLYDDVTARTGPGWSLTLVPEPYVDPASVPLDGSNIVDRAARLLAALHGVEVAADVSIHKTIPVAGGLAGGSADAAAALVALDRLWDLRTSDDEMVRLAAELGSDVPFALFGGHALGTGRGEQVEPLLTSADPLWWVVVPSSQGLSTPEVYRHFDALFPDAPAEPMPATKVLDALRAENVTALARALHNDLQPAAIDLRPELGALIDIGQEEGALRGLVSGSGPTCIFLCDEADAARAVAGALQDRKIVETVLVANGPVAGAHLVELA